MSNFLGGESQGPIGVLLSNTTPSANYHLMVCYLCIFSILLQYTDARETLTRLFTLSALQ